MVTLQLVLLILSLLSFAAAMFRASKSDPSWPVLLCAGLALQVLALLV